MSIKTVKRIGLALEGFGVAITTCGVVDMTQWILMTGVITSAAGRALTMFAREDA
jgi:hypothetical protein